MPGNRRRNANTVPLAMMASWIIVCLALGVAGLGYVWMKNQLHTSSRTIKTLERELASLSKLNEAARWRIVESSSMGELGKRFNDRNKFNGLMPIPQGKPLFVGRAQPSPVDVEEASDFQRIANREGAQR